MSVNFEVLVSDVLENIWSQADICEETEIVNGILEFLSTKGRVGDIDTYSDEYGNSDKVQQLKDLLENLEPMLREANNQDEQSMLNDLILTLDN